MINAKIQQFRPSKHLDASVPGSKSMTNRALIMAAMAEGTSRLFGILNSDDSHYCLDVLQKLGVSVHQIDETTFDLTSPGIQNLCSEETLYIGSAGTTARFLPGLLATSESGKRYVIDASDQLKSRPLQSLLEVLEQLGAVVTYGERPYCLPFSVNGMKLSGGEVHMTGDVSSQFISGLLMAAPYFETGLSLSITTPIVQSQYVQITVEMMRAFGVEVEVSADYRQFKVKPQTYRACTYHVEADISTAGYFFAMGLLFDTRVQLEVNKQTAQPDIELLHILQKMGAEVTWEGDIVSICNDGHIRGNQTFHLQACSDQALTVGVLAAFADGAITLEGIGHIRHHESDRIQVLHDNLALLGIRSEMRDTGITVYPGMVKRGVVLPTYDDHRVAMAFALIGLKVGDITIEDSECTKKTFPNYFQYLQQLGATILFEEK